jgi:hypothetical protein
MQEFTAWRGAAAASAAHTALGLPAANGPREVIDTVLRPR